MLSSDVLSRLCLQQLCSCQKENTIPELCFHVSLPVFHYIDSMQVCFSLWALEVCKTTVLMLVQKRQELAAIPTATAAVGCTSYSGYKLWFPNRALARQLFKRPKATQCILFNQHIYLQFTAQCTNTILRLIKDGLGPFVSHQPYQGRRANAGNMLVSKVEKTAQIITESIWIFSFS